jgi:hypothetical protein
MELTVEEAVSSMFLELFGAVIIDEVRITSVQTHAAGRNTPPSKTA